MAKKEILFSVGDYVGYDKDAIPVAEFATLAENLGWDGITIGDHPAGEGPSNEPLTVLTYAAAVTKRILLSTSVLVLPLCHPVRLAKQVANLDMLSNGRVILGVGVGEAVKAYEAYGIPISERAARTDEYIEILKGFWTEPFFTYHGRFFQFEEITMNPKPVQKPHPPIWIGGRMGGVEIRGDERKFKSKTAAIRRTARYGDGWIPNYMSPEQYKESVQLLRQYAAEYGRENYPFTLTHNVSALVRDTYDEALREAAGHARYGEVRNEEFVRKYDIIGSPKDCIERIEAFIDVGVTHFLLKPMSSRDSNSARGKREQMELIAKHIIPYFK